MSGSDPRSGSGPRGGRATDQAEPTDFESLDAEQTPPEAGVAGRAAERPLLLVGYLLAGVYLGFIFVLSEVVSWYRIQEMFRFQSFHMYGIIGLAVIVGGAFLQLMKRARIRSLSGSPVVTRPKEWGGGRIPGARYWIGGTAFGMGWALLGACPGPIFALLGSGITVMVIPLAAALAGTWTYAALRPRLPH